MLIIPEPKHMHIGQEGTFVLRDGIPIVLPQYNQADFHSAKCLKRYMQEAAGITGVIEAHNRVDRLKSYILLLNLAQSPDHIRNEAEARYVASLRPEGYVLEIAPDRIVIVSQDDCGLYYGVQTLRQILNNVRNGSLPAMEICDYPDLCVRGVMLDMSKVPTMETLHRLVTDLSEYKMNHLQLYIEPHMFRSRSHPLLSEGTGAINAEELMELGDACARVHIDLVPNFQSFGHVARVLSHPEYAHLAEDDRIKFCLSPAVEQTYTFLAEQYDEFLPLFRSSWMNAGCDETFEVRDGKGKSAKLAETIGTAGVFFGHVEKVMALARERGKETMIWADQITHGGDPAYLDRSLQLPDDIVYVNWWYDAEWDYAAKERMLEETGRRHLFCPGTSSWLRLYPEYPMAKRNVRNFTAGAVPHGSLGLLMSDWGDYGHLPGQSYYGLLYAANLAWHTQSDDDERFDRAYGLIVVGDGDDTFVFINRILSDIHNKSRIDHEFRNVMTEVCFYDGLLSDEWVDKADPGLVLWGGIDRSRRASEYTDPGRMGEVARMLGEAKRAFDSCKAGEWRQKQLYDEIGYTLRLLTFACRKYELIQVLKGDNYDADQVKRDMNALLEENDRLQETFKSLWLRSARPEGMGWHLARFDRVRDDISLTMERLGGK